MQFKSEKKLIVCDEMSTINSLLSPPLGSLFQAHLRGGGLFEKGGLLKFRNDDGISSP